MRFDRFEPSRRGYGSGWGASYHYVCTRCGAEGTLWADTGDDELITHADIQTPDGAIIPVGWDDLAWEWRVRKLIRA